MTTEFLTSTTFEVPGHRVERTFGGNAVVGVRFDSSDIGNGLSEIVAYGTAAQVVPA